MSDGYASSALFSKVSKKRGGWQSQQVVIVRQYRATCSCWSKQASSNDGAMGGGLSIPLPAQVWQGGYGASELHHLSRTRN